MRTIIMLVLAVFVVAFLNFAIYEKEQIIANGETMLVELAPVDPRSLMQGDYMQLRYAIEAAVPDKELGKHEKRGYIVIAPDKDNVAQYQRFYKGEELSENEALLRFHKRYGGINIVPRSFFFQEGHAKHYDNAKYGVFKFDGSGKSLLAGLANEDGKQIVVKDIPKEK